jgi:hypothetical protein
MRSITIRAPGRGPGAVAASVDEVGLMETVDARGLPGGVWVNMLTIRLSYPLALRLRVRHALPPQATLRVVLSAGLIDALRSATKNESYQLWRSALRSTRIDVSHRSMRSACGM